LSCIAWDDPVKGVDILLKAFKEVISKYKIIHSFIIGVEQDHSKLYKECCKSGLVDNVHWTGIVDNAWKVLNVSDIYVQPSRSEGLPFATLEAMSLKRPVVASRV
jgi:glycosyltransferase involved in cell wall biosynthesis